MLTRLSRLLAVLLVVLIAFSWVHFNIGRYFYHGVTREYWVAVVPEKWNIVPNGVDGMSGAKYAAKDTTIQALLYKQYTANWQKQLPSNSGGQPGPTMFANVGDTIKVHFKNMDTFYNRPHSMHPHGVHYTPANDGSYVYDNQLPGSAVPVGQTYTYTWSVGHDSVGAWVYHDHSVQAVDNTVLGEYGLLVLSEPGTPKPDKQMVTFFDEMPSGITGLPYEFDTINGRSFIGNTPVYTASVGQHVQWIVAALGSDFHTFHIHGHRWQYGGRDQDLLELGPAEAKMVDFTEDQAGYWLVHCHVDEHMMNGMSATYLVRDKKGRIPGANSAIKAQAAEAAPMPGMDMDDN